MTQPLIYAHRGASAYAPENTMAAFKKAIELNADGIEIDVQMSKDGHLIICHDEKVDRTTNGKGYIKDINLKDLKLLDAGFKFSSNFIGEKIPTLIELMELIKDNNMVLNIELKNNVIDYKGIEQKVIDTIKQYNMENRIIISSFNHNSLYKVKDIDSTIKTGVLYSKKLKNPITYAKNIKADAIHPSYKRLNRFVIAKAKKENIEINTFTVNIRDYMKLLIDIKIDGIITDYPDIAQQLK
ncbi:glycerophosphodiester phosphodiesterase [Clostridium sp. D2Q-11]|uniref:Glycerophosphodiester phosphodiesterase n=1 Tax=Anaeromonas frigoriresistens TaxID=2683708 RepID=A0A942UVB3_9FIRM|nr:glycerophosphodiester phosphodiesterase [Anaeromonas frigoriresistens]MBS4537091.1 glycerophosphodiester phosphodiesterase [Anaeromonas frigoriresistens]